MALGKVSAKGRESCSQVEFMSSFMRKWLFGVSPWEVPRNMHFFESLRRVAREIDDASFRDSCSKQQKNLRLCRELFLEKSY